MKLCKDCKWCKPAWFFFVRLGLDIAVCTHPNKEFVIDLVTGEKIANYIEECSVLRSGSYKDLTTPICGREGRWFEPKEGA